jgi:hypothetical protein
LYIIDTLEKDSLKISENVLEKMRGSSFVWNHTSSLHHPLKKSTNKQINNI